MHLNSDSFSEKGDAAALKGGENNRDAVLSTLGLRASKAFALSDQQQLELSGTLGWQHNLGNTRSEDHLAFVNGNTAFSVQSVSMDRNAAVVGARAGWALGRDTRLNLDYNGLLGSREKDHGVGLTLDWQF
ncbi:Extracellular serine protease precursor [compost metagenome]